MPYESFRDLAMYNTQTLIGCVDERGSAWHRRDDLMGDESNHYPGLIPLEDLTRRVFNWSPQRAEVAYLLAITPEEVQGRADRVRFDGQDYRVVRTQADRMGVLRDDNDYDLGVFKSGAVHPPYQVTLIEEAERLTGTQLGVSAAGILGEGGRAWVEYSMPKTLHDDKSGLDYRPNLVRADSMDGSLSMTTYLSNHITICGNTMTWNMLEASRSGRIYRRKHTSNFGADLNSERQALGIIEQVDTEFISELHTLLEMELTKAQRIEVMDIIVPVEGKEGRGLTLAENKRAQLVAMDTNPMVSEWIGTGFGELQRYNTFDHWLATAKGTGQWERNTWRALSGKRTVADREVVDAVLQVVGV